MEDCVFCKIKKGEIPSTKVYEDEDFMIIKDINPRAKIHLLAIPHKHIPYIDMMSDEDVKVLGKIFGRIANMQEKLGITNGYRLIINQGEDGLQDVKHIHIHILGGEKLRVF